MSAAETGATTGHGMTGEQAAGYRDAAIRAGATRTKQDDINDFNRAQWNQRFTPYNQRNMPKQKGQGFFGSLFGGFKGLADKLRTVDGQVMPQSYFSEEEREKRRALRGIETIMNRKNPVTNLTNKRLGQLYDTAYGVGQGDRNFFGGADIGKSPAMLQANELGLYTDRTNAGNAGVQVGADQNLRGTNELVDVDKVREMINNAKSKNVTSLPVDDDVMQRFTFADMGIDTNAANDFNTQMAKNYSREDLEALGAEKGFFGANDQLEALENYYQGAKKFTGTPKGSLNFWNPSDVRSKVGSLGEIPFSGYAGVNMDLVPQDFLSEKVDFTTQESPLELITGKAQGGRVGYNEGGRVGILAAF